MSFHSALQSSIFGTYAVIIAALLASAGIVLLVLAYGLKKDTAKVWLTYRSWLVMVPVAMLAALAGREATIVMFTVLSLLAMKEYARVTGLYADWWMTGTVYLGIISIAITTLVHRPSTGEPGWYGLFMTLPVYVVAALVLVPVVRNRTKGQLQAMGLAVLGFIYLGWMLLHVAFLANCPQAYGYLFYLVFAVELNDVAAFTCGKLFGHRPFRSNISPKKTWGGAIGAFVVSMALPWGLRFSFPYFGLLQLILTGLIVGVGGQAGDLVISVIKRDVGVKDMGSAIPGHGGVLDRVDSLIFVAPLFLHMVDYFYGHW